MSELQATYRTYGAPAIRTEIGNADSAAPLPNESHLANAGVNIVVRISCRPLRDGSFVSKLEEEHGTKWSPPHVALQGASAVPTRVFLV